MKASLIKIFTTIIVAWTLPLTASAQDPNPFTDCGIGAAIFDNDTAATISNVIWDLGTTAIISATVSPDMCEGSSAVAARMIFKTYAEVSEDTARGEGEHISALLDIASCSDASRPVVVESIRSGFADLLSEEGYAGQSQLEKSEAYYNVFMTSVGQEHAASCSIS